MSQKYAEISDKLSEFISQQKMFFVGTATADSRVNISPKGMDSLRVLDKNRVVWLNVTGSGNETAAHIQDNSRMTIMFASFEGKPMILRLYGKARVIHKNEDEWETLYSQFKPMVGARQVFDLSVDLVQTSCGMAVPFLDYVEERDQLDHWAALQGEEGIKNYWEKNNQFSLDDKPTNIMSKTS